ncbi:MAG TPA: LamG-like jellyroll fold domain-containing protein [Lacipirellulaceae bacterium]|nr:LamG-like jellyroll fold domain-containing protein [Lacipirellulaceae bacterium]
MTLQRGLICASVAAAALAIAGAPAAQAATRAYWRFEGDGVTVPADGTYLKDTNGRTAVQPDGILAIDSSGSGNSLYTWDVGATGHQYRPNVPATSVLQSGLPNTRSIQNNGGFPATFTWSRESLPSNDIETMKPLAWTIEASILSTNIASNRTFVGRDGNRDNPLVGDANRAPLYFKTLNGNLQILFTDEAGNAYDLTDPTGPISTNTWYNVAAVSDGTTLSLYKDAGFGYNLVNSMALTPGDTRLNYDDDGSTTVGDPNWGWTVGRGRYSGSNLQADGHVDRWLGNIDEVRISDEALSPAQFLFKPNFNLTLVVNKNTGAVAIRNISSAPVTIDYYQIDSAGQGALKPSTWNSLSDQNIDAGVAGDFNGSNTVNGADLTILRNNFGTGTTKAQGDADRDGDVDGNDFVVWQQQVGKTPGEGDSWDEAGGSSANLLSELFLSGATTIAPGAQLSLGAAFDTTVNGPGVDGNLVFRYGVKGSAQLTPGGTQYVTTGPAVAVPEPTALLSGVVALAALAVGGRSRRAG